MIVEVERFRRLLLWYPRSWREGNGDVLLATMLDEAERAGRTRPSAGERWSALGHGLGTRLDAALALGVGLAALAVAAVAGVITWMITPPALAGAGWVLPTLIALCSWLVAVGAVSLARQRGLVTEPRAAVLGVLFLVAVALTAMTQIGWGLAFDAADDGTEAVGLGAVWVWLFGAASILGITALALFTEALLRHTALRSAARVVLATVCGAVLAPTIGVTLLSPTVPAVGAAAVAVLALIPMRAARRASRAAAGAEFIAPIPGEVPARTRRAARRLAWFSAAGGAFGVVFALTGSLWTGAADSTAAMSQGITIALAAALPLLAAIGIVVVARRRSRVAHTWGPLVLVALALAAVVVAHRGAPAWEAMAPGFAVAAGLGGAALAWWLAPRLRGPVRTRIPVAVLSGVAYAALFGVLVAAALAFVVPVIAVVVGFFLSTRAPLAGSAVGAQPAPAARRA